MPNKINPFAPNSTVQTSLFGGRTEYVWDILRKLNEVKNGKTCSFYLYGERGIGKTALAKFIRYLSTANNVKFYNLNFLTCYYSASRNQPFKSVLEESLNQLSNQLDKSFFEKAKDKIGEFCQNGKFKLGLYGAEASIELDENRKNTEQIEIKDQFIKITTKIIEEIKNEKESNTKNGLIIIIDEMDNISDLNEYASIIRGITTSLDFEDIGYISFIFIGYEDGMNEFIQSDRSIARTIDKIFLEEMPEEEVIETFEKGFEEAQVKWDKEVLKKNVFKTGGYPLAIQVIGHRLIETDVDNNINRDDWDNSMFPCARKMQEIEYSSYYTYGKKNLRMDDKIVLVLASANYTDSKTLTIKEIEKFSKVKNPSQYMKNLTTKGTVLYDEDSKQYSIKRGLFSTSIVLDRFSSLKDDTEQIEEFLNLITEIKDYNKLEESTSN